RALAERVALLAGQPAALLERARRRIVVAPGAEVLVATLRAHGTDVVMVSGGFLAFARPLAARLGCAAVEANELEIAGGRLTGRVVEPILDRAAKRRALERHCAARGLEPSQAAAVGDGANDLELLRAAGLGVAYRAKPAVAAAARQRIDHGDLTALLYFQGYRREELAC
ncbi:MAG: HAD family hydrolase, partial [Acidobacteria bacterium]